MSNNRREFLGHVFNAGIAGTAFPLLAKGGPFSIDWQSRAVDIHQKALERLEAGRHLHLPFTSGPDGKLVQCDGNHRLSFDQEWSLDKHVEFFEPRMLRNFAHYQYQFVRNREYEVETIVYRINWRLQPKETWAGVYVGGVPPHNGHFTRTTLATVRSTIWIPNRRVESLCRREVK